MIPLCIERYLWIGRDAATSLLIAYGAPVVKLTLFYFLKFNFTLILKS